MVAPALIPGRVYIGLDFIWLYIGDNRSLNMRKGITRLSYLFDDEIDFFEMTSENFFSNLI